MSDINTYFILFYLLISGGQIHDGHFEFGSQASCEKAAEVMLRKLSEPHPDTGQPMFTWVKVYCLAAY